ncbi:MAG: ArsA family ATPase [Actinomycetes bacterium]
MTTTGFDALLHDARVVICAGSGGVGKTTTAAVLAIAAARRGRRSVVVTIDPARRLADALGLPELAPDPVVIDPAHWAGTHDHGGGRLSAMMLDPKQTFDALVFRYAADAQQAERILTNGFYRSISSALGGTQEYMAMEKLHELHEDGDYDLIVVDTPPSRHALDFLDAPERLLRLLDNRVFRLITAPARTGLRAAGVAVQALVRSASRIIGTAVVDDIVAFFRAFEGMEEGFRTRARRVQRLIAEPSTRFVLVTSPRRDAVEEAEHFAQAIGDHGYRVDGLIVNRVHPEFGPARGGALHARAAALRALPAGDAATVAARGRTADRLDVLADFQEVAARERQQLEGVQLRLGPGAVVAFVPFLSRDVHDVDALDEIAALLLGP